ncbi:MAG: hypothetical protein SFX74_03225 [Fimbriimonadaceae bacterium]|nr:hypothetical protein [Fimbriimonadaceae bacterium]
MQATWQSLVDYARGLASESDARAIESDPAAMARVALLREVAEAHTVDVPEFARLRAKAILPALQRNESNWLRRLVAFGPTPVAGYRNAELANASFTVALQPDVPEAGTISVRREQIPQSDRVALVGQVEVADGRGIVVRVDGGPERWCDEFGQFTLEIPQSVREIEVVDVLHETIYTIELP